ncbi:MAG: DUF456 domain-containing protein [Deltaproteobacteria bacterium]|nr:MAG: DUF456 domain-containing protein [Deltaproteobacteria bacterium]
MAIALIILGLLCALIGLVGCIFPVIPGPPLSFLALILLSLAKNWEPFSSTFLIIMGGLALLVTILDYVVPLVGAKKYGASKWGVWISMIGMLIGVLFFPPWGMLFGAFVGAFAGEVLAGKKGRKSLQAAWGVFVGNVVSIGFKLAYCGAVLFFYVKEMF